MGVTCCFPGVLQCRLLCKNNRIFFPGWFLLSNQKFYQVRTRLVSNFLLCKRPRINAQEVVSEGAPYPVFFAINSCQILFCTVPPTLTVGTVLCGICGILVTGIWCWASGLGSGRVERGTAIFALIGSRGVAVTVGTLGNTSSGDSTRNLKAFHGSCMAS